MQLKSIRDLNESAGIPLEIIDSWIDYLNTRSGGNYSDIPLTELQSAALSYDGTLPNGSRSERNLVVAGPTSAGKTLVAQAIAAAAIAHRPPGKVLYLVPLRALVTEKWDLFSKVFKGFNVIPASSDYPWCDARIAERNWHVIVAVFDKVYRWLSSPAHVKELLENVDVVLIDEIQVLEYRERGERLEAILSFLRWHQQCCRKLGAIARPRIVALTSSNSIARHLSGWLDADIAPNRPVERPVPLYEGWVTPSSEPELYSNAADRIVLEPSQHPEKLRLAIGSLPPVRGARQRTIQLTDRFLRQGLRVLIYVAEKEFAQQLARSLAKKLGDRKLHEQVRNELAMIEESPVRDLLEKTLLARVGIHFGDMTPSERHIVERGFLVPGDDPPVKVVVATPTLGMGINLPADVVLMLHRHTYGESHIGTDPSIRRDASSHRAMERPLTVLEYRNFAGRAGRLKLNGRDNAFGLCLLVVEPQQIKDAKRLLHGDVQPLRSSLLQPIYGLEPHLLTFLAVVGLSPKGNRIEQTLLDILRSSYACYIEPSASKIFCTHVSTALRAMKELDLLADSGLTGPGNAAASHHLSMGGILGMLGLATRMQELWPARKLDLLYELATLPEAQLLFPSDNCLPREDRPDRRHSLQESLRSFLQQVDSGNLFAHDDSSVLHQFLTRQASWPGTLDGLSFKRLMRALAVWGWAEGFGTKRLCSEFPRSSLGALKQLGEQMAALVSALRSVWEQTEALALEVGQQRSLSYQLWLFEQSLRYGVPLKVVALPIIVSYSSVAQERTPIVFTRRFYMDILATIGSCTDPRDLIDQQCPDTVKHATNWETLQSALKWWSSRQQQAVEDRDEIGFLSLALDLLASGAFDQPLITTPTASPWLAAAGSTESAFREILKRAQERIAALNPGTLDGIRVLSEQALARHPISAKLLRLQHNHPTDPYWVTNLGSEFINVGLVPGKPTLDVIERFLTGNRGSGQIVVCGELPDIRVQTLIRSQSRPRLRALITIEALVAGSLFVQWHPEFVQRLLRILLSKIVVIPSFEDILKRMFREELQVSESNSIKVGVVHESAGRPDQTTDNS